MANDDDRKAAAAAKEVSSAFGGVSKVIGRIVPGFSQLGTELDGMTKAFTILSNTGNAFNNDMIGMRAAAAQARMTLDEYAKVVEDNRKAFTGLGGSVSQGTKVFGEFSKSFFESGITENLRQMGYTSKDLNEILATQIGFQKSTTDNSIDGQMRTAKAATELGQEMDLVAKLTGVSRREQEEKLKKAAVDGQVEAKFRLIGAQQGADAEKEARANYAKQILAADAMGQGQLFKEFFATGTATSQEAQEQLALFGDASMKTAESAQQLSQAQIELSKSSMESAKIANMKNQSDTTLMTIAATGVGSASKAVIKNIEINDAAYQGMKTFMKGTEDVIEAMKKQKDAIIAEQQKRNTFTETLITTNNRLQDFRAGLVKAFVEIVNKSGETGTLKTVNTFVKQLPGSVDAKTTNQELLDKFKIDKGKDNLANRTENVLTEGPIADFFQGVDTLAKEGIQAVIKGGLKLIEVGSDLQKSVEANRQQASGIPTKTEPTKTDQPPLKSREGGSIEMAGTMFEDWGKGTLAELHGLESVIKPDQMMNFAKGMSQQGASTAFNNMKGMLAGQNKDTTKGIDIAKLVGDIKTSVGKVEIINWPKDLISEVEIKAPPAAGAAAKPAESKPSTTEEDKAKAAAEAKEREKRTAEERRKDEEQEAKFRIIGIRDGAEAEKKARDDYNKQREQQESSTQSRTEKAARAAEEVTIKSGDTLTSLAKKYNISVEELMKANPAIKDANKFTAGAKLIIPSVEKKETTTNDIAKKAQTEAEQAQVKQQEQEAKFRMIGIEKGEQAEKKAREDYAKEQAQQAALAKWREDELKIRITGIREGADAAQRMRDAIEKRNQEDTVKVSKTSETKVTVNGKDADPNSKEGQIVLKQMEDSKARLETMMNSLMNGVVEKRTEPKQRPTEVKMSDMPNFDNFIAKLQGKLTTSFESKNTETKLTVNGKDVDPDSAEGKEAMAQLDEAKSRMFGLFGNIKTNFEDVEKLSKESNEELKSMFTDMIPITEMQSQQSEFKSNFTDEQKKFIDDYQGMSKDNQDFMKSALERSNGIDRESIEKHNDIVADLQKKKNERELTAEEEHQLSESEAIARNISDDVRRRQEQLDMINNMSSLADQVELERLDDYARKELATMQASDAEKLDATKAANDLIHAQFLLANDAILDSVGGMTDAAIAAQDVFMQEINTLFDMPSDAAAEHQQALLEEANALFDIPESADTAVKTRGIGGLGGEPINQAVQDLADQVQGLKEFEEDEGGEAIGGEMDSAFAKDEDSYVAQALQDFQDLIPDSIVDDAAFASGPGDASAAGFDAYAPSDVNAAGIDFADGGPNDASVAGIDFVAEGTKKIESAMKSLEGSLPQAKSLEKEGPKSTPNYSSIDMGAFTLGPDGMPIPKAKAQGQAAANAAKQEKDEKKSEDKKATQASVRAADNEIDKDNETKKEGEGEKKVTKTLDDVVKALEVLNSNVGKLTSKVEESAKQQVQATRSLNGNLYNM